MTADPAILSVITGTGVCGVFVVLFITGLIYPKPVVDDLRAERDALRASAKADQERADAAVAAAQATRDVFAAIQAGVSLGGQQRSLPRNGGGS